MPKSLLNSLDYSPVELSFGTSGLRGLANDMTDLECYINTRGFLNFLLSTGDTEAGANIALAGDLRDSTSRILKAVAQGIMDSELNIIYLDKLPTPAAAYFGLKNSAPVIMVTGSHIPADRNGIKFYKREGEVLKEDEAAIKNSVSTIRKRIYSETSEKSLFDGAGSLKQSPLLPVKDMLAEESFIERYVSLFDASSLSGKKIIVYQHSSLAADILVELLKSLGAEVIAVDRSSKFIPIDTENVTPQNQAYFKSLAEKYPENFAIVSADGDADRPFVIDENGIFHRGGVLGAITAEYLDAKHAVVPISASDALDAYLKNRGISLEHTKIGSPYVISTMEALAQSGASGVVGWEVNGGFLTASDIRINNQGLTALPTRDAFLPIVCALISAAQSGRKLSELFMKMPQRFTQAGLLDGFPIEKSQAILAKYSEDSAKNHRQLEDVFSTDSGFSKIKSTNSLDGIRITFENGDIAHIRPSGNAPQLRIYSVADSQKRADEIVEVSLAEPNGLLRCLERSISD